MPIERSGGGGGGGFTNPMTTAGDIIIENNVPAPARLPIGITGQALEVASGLPAWQFPPGWEFDYAQITANVTVTATSTATPTNVVVGNAVTYDGATRVKIEFYAPVVEVTGNSLALYVYDGTTVLAEIAGTFTSVAAETIDLPSYGCLFLTPSAASHTYKIAGIRGSSPTSNNGLVAAGTGTAGAFAPSFIRVTRA